MLDIKHVYEEKSYDENDKALVALASDIFDLNWDQAYWLAKCFNDYRPNDLNDNTIIDLFEHSFDSGLSLSTDKEKYIDACECLSRLYINSKDYDLANNLLMELTKLLDPVPDWVYINYCISLAKSETVIRHAMDPTQYFKLLDSISMESYIQRARVYQIFLSRLYEIKESDPSRKINIKQFEELKYKYIGHSFDEE